MKRYSRTNNLEGIDLAVIYGAYAILPSLRVSENFRNTMAKADLPIERADKSHPFGFYFGMTLDTKTIKTGLFITKPDPEFSVRGERRIGDKGYVIINCHYSPRKINDHTLIVAAQGMHVGILSLNEILDSFTQKTSLKEIDLPIKYLDRLQTTDFQWATRLQQLKEHY